MNQGSLSLFRGHIGNVTHTHTLLHPRGAPQVSRKWGGFDSGALWLFIPCKLSRKSVHPDSTNQPAIFENCVTIVD